MPDRPDALLQAIPASPALDTLLDERDDVLIQAQLDAELQTVRTLEQRADSKAGTLLQLCSALLVAGLALLSTGRLPAAAQACGWVTIALVGAAVLTLTAALRPQLGGNFGFVRWAATAPEQIVAAFSADPAVGLDHTRRARQLHQLSRSLHTRFARVRTAQTLLVAALTTATLAAAVSTWVR